MPTPPNPRLFLAVALSPKLKQRLAEVEEQLSSHGLHVHWVPPENIHLTLHFLGSTPRNIIDDLHHDLGACAHSLKPFDVNVGGLGAFKSLEDPRIFWVGVTDPYRKLAELVEKTRNALNRYRLFKLDEREYVPHLTLARLKAKPSWDPQRLEALLPQFKSLDRLGVEKISMFESILGKGEPKYEVMEEYSLGGEA